MYSEYERLEPTEAQRFADEKFLNDVKDEYINPLVKDFEQQIDGYSEKDAVQRRAYVLKLAEPLTGVGDFLPLGDALVYAGKCLGKTTEWMLNGVSFKQYKPRFTGDSDGFRSFVGERLIMGESEYFLTEEREEYEALPPWFKAAFLCRYIKTKVIADDRSVIAFVLGASATLETFRYSVTAKHNEGHFGGWAVRIADMKPDKDFWNALHKVVLNYGRVPQAKPKQRRRPDPKTELACMYAYEVEQSGVILDARKGGIGYTKLMADMKLELGDKVRDYTPDTFGRVYREWKKKNGIDMEGR